MWKTLIIFRFVKKKKTFSSAQFNLKSSKTIIWFYYILGSADFQNDISGLTEIANSSYWLEMTQWGLTSSLVPDWVKWVSKISSLNICPISATNTSGVKAQTRLSIPNRNNNIDWANGGPRYLGEKWCKKGKGEEEEVDLRMCYIKAWHGWRYGCLLQTWDRIVFNLPLLPKRI